MTQTKTPPVRLGLFARWTKRIKLNGGYPAVAQPRQHACGGSAQFDLTDPDLAL